MTLVMSEVTYREDGDKNASSAKHTVANGVSVFGRVLDGLIVAVKPSVVRLNCAGLYDQERQAGWCYEAVGDRERERERKGERWRCSVNETQITEVVGAGKS